MIGHGKRDLRAPFSQAEALRDALKARHYPVEWMAVEGEGHGFYRSENRVALYEKLLEFLDRNIGADALSGSSAKVQPCAPWKACVHARHSCGSVVEGRPWLSSLSNCLRFAASCVR